MLAGCSWTGSGAESSPRGTATYGISGNHGGYHGQAAHYYDLGYKQCRQLTLADLAQNPSNGNASSDNLLTFAVVAPGRYKQAAKDGCDAGEASAKRMENCKVSQSESTSEMDCSYPSTSEPWGAPA
jgi:hypothetical protein